MTDKTVEAARKLLEATSGVSLWWTMHDAQQECADLEPFKDNQVALSFMGSGASTQVTVGELRAMVKARNELYDLLKSAEIPESDDAGRPE